MLHANVCNILVVLLRNTGKSLKQLVAMPRIYFFFFQIFHDVLLDLRRVVLSSYILNDNICDPFFVLSELCEYRVDGGNYRPICYLVSGYEWVCAHVCYSAITFHDNLAK